MKQFIKDKKDVAVTLISVSKKYEIHHEKPTLVEKFVKGNNETFWALKNINLTIKKGERVGIIGPNGSGKTTLLKLIAGITTPTAGSITTHGKVVSLIDLQAGFHEDLTGEQNIYLNGMLLGLSKKEIDNKIHQIIQFADIRQFIDAPLFTYSQGMALRLGFAIAVYTCSDILILDEGLSVGDQNFQEKARQKLNALLKKGITVVYVSHIPTLLRKICQRFIVMNEGTIEKDGGITEFNNYFKL